MLRCLIIQLKIFYKIRMHVQSQLFIVLLAICVQSADRLLSVQQIMRHGARYAYAEIKNDPISEADALNHRLKELTEQGKHMHYQLGKDLYQKYWKALFQGTKYEKQFHPEQLYVYSTNTNRTIESVMAQLIGWLEGLQPEKLPISELKHSLPPFPGADQLYAERRESFFYVFGEKGKNVHILPVHTEPDSEELSFQQKLKRKESNFHNDFLVKIVGENCPKAARVLKAHLKSKIVQQIASYPKVKEYFAAVSKQLGYQVGFDITGDTICDSYQVNTHQGLPVFQVFKDSDMSRVSYFLHFVYMILEDSYTLWQKKVGSTWLLQELIGNMRRAIESEGPKITIFSTHDWSQIVILGALRMYTLECIKHSFLTNTTSPDCISQYTGYASNTVFQLWETDSKGHIIKVVYNGVERKIPVCGNKFYCTLQQFQEWAKSLQVDPNEQCEMPRIGLRWNQKLPKLMLTKRRHQLLSQIN